MTMAAPVPDTTRGSRRTAWWLLVALELVIAANAVYGGTGLIVNGMGMPLAWLEGTPFGSWVVPGTLLLALVAVPMAFAVLSEFTRTRLAYPASLIAGVVLVGWIGSQLLVLRRYFFLQPVLAVAGVAVVVLAWWAHGRRPAPR
jgi:drug/metabolite transporter superfamily protein YnfA